MTGLVVANAALGAVGGYVLRRTAESVVLAARRRLVDRLLGLTISGLDRAEPGDLMSRVSSDTTLLRDVTNRLHRGCGHRRRHPDRDPGADEPAGPVLFGVTWACSAWRRWSSASWCRGSAAPPGARRTAWA